MIEELDKSLNLAPVIVPADGNCLAWSLRCLYCNEFDKLDFKRKNAKRSISYVRSIIREMWVEKAQDPRWRHIFSFCYQDFMPAAEGNQDHMPEEPSSKAPEVASEPSEPSYQDHMPEKEGNQDHLPEEPASEAPEEPRVQPRVKRATNAEPIPITRREPVDARMKTAESVRAQQFMEPPVPDVEEIENEALLKPRRMKRRPDPIEEPDGDRDLTKRKVRPHARLKKIVDPEKEKDKYLAQWLARTKQFAYGDFLRFHKRAAIFRNSGQCPKGLPEFRKALMAGQLPECAVCVRWMHENDVTVELVQEVLKDAEAGPAEQKPQDPQPEPKPQDPLPEPQPEDPEPADETSAFADPMPKKTRAEQRAECVAYVNSVQHLEAIDAPNLLYRCKICVSRMNPDGKSNRLGEKPTLKSVRGFIRDHLSSQCHVRALAALQAADEFGKVAEDGEAATQPCDGYNVNDPNSSGTLHYYHHEFVLWTNHSKLDTKAMHTYHQNRTTGAWMVKHKECPGVCSVGSLCCSRCAALGQPKSVQRLVVSFCRNFYSGMLLNKRLFGTPQERMMLDGYGFELNVIF